MVWVGGWMGCVCVYVFPHLWHMNNKLLQEWCVLKKTE